MDRQTWRIVNSRRITQKFTVENLNHLQNTRNENMIIYDMVLPDHTITWGIYGERPSVRVSMHPPARSFWPLYWKLDIHFISNLVYTLVSVQTWFSFGPRWPNFFLIVFKNWLKVVVCWGFGPLSWKPFILSISTLLYALYGPRWCNRGRLVT